MRVRERTAVVELGAIAGKIIGVPPREYSKEKYRFASQTGGLDAALSVWETQPQEAVVAPGGWQGSINGSSQVFDVAIFWGAPQSGRP